MRNKTELTFGYRYLFDKETQANDDGIIKIKTVPALGFMVTGWSGGVCRPHCCDNIPREACHIVDIMDEFLSSSPLPPYDSKSHKGFWRILTVRTSRRTKECMLIFMHTPVSSGGAGDEQGVDEEQFESEKKRLVSTLTNASLETGDEEVGPLKVTSIFFQEFEGLSHPSPDCPVQVSCN